MKHLLFTRRSLGVGGFAPRSLFIRRSPSVGGSVAALLLFAATLSAQPARTVRCLLLNSSHEPPRPERFAKITPLSGGNTVEQGTDAGIFELKIPGAKPGQRLELLVMKDGYQVLGPNPLVFTYAVPESETEVVQIAIIKKTDFDSRKADYEKAIEKRIQQAHAALLDSIARLQTQAISAGERTALTKFVSQQNQEITELRKNKDDLAARLAQVDLDQASEFAQLALKKFRGEGDIKAALALMPDEKLDRFWDNMLSQEEKVKRARQQGVENYMIRARLLVADGQFPPAYENYLEAVEKDSVNLENLFEVAVFLAKQNQHQHAIALHEKCLTLVKTIVQRAGLLNNLGNLYSDMAQMANAEKAYQESLSYYQTLENENPGVFLSNIASTLNNLGNHYKTNQRMAKAETAYATSLSIRKELADKVPHDYLPGLAMALNNMGEYYRINRKIPEAEKFYTESINIYRALVNKDPDAFLSELAMALNNMGECYRVAHQTSKAEESYAEALSIYRVLVARNPDAFLKGLANTLNNMGVFYYLNRRMLEAGNAYTEALSIRRKLAADKSPLVFLPDMAATLSNLCLFYKDNQKPTEAEQHCIEALRVYRWLVDRSSITFSPSMAAALNNFGALYITLKEYPKALDYYEEAFQIRQTELQAGQVHFLNEWVEVLNNIFQAKDSTAAHQQYALAARAGLLLASSCDSLRHLDSLILHQAVSEYGSLTWWALLAKDYALAERAGLRCLALDGSRIIIWTNIGHALWLSGKEKEARAAWLHLQGKMTSGKTPYATVLTEDWDALEAAGVAAKGAFEEARKWVGKW